jgi:hypothetical protein
MSELPDARGAQPLGYVQHTREEKSHTQIHEYKTHRSYEYVSKNPQVPVSTCGFWLYFGNLVAQTHLIHVVEWYYCSEIVEVQPH